MVYYQLRKKILNKINHIFWDFIYYFINRLIYKEKKSILFIPHHNCRNDNYDMFNPYSDNVLCLFNSIIKDDRFSEYSITLGYYHSEKLSQYEQACGNSIVKNISFVNACNYRSLLKSFCRNKLIITATSLRKYPIKANGQIVFCLNYYMAFMKCDLYKFMNHGGYKAMIKEQNAMYKNFDYHLSTSDICSKFIALDNCMFYKNFVTLGFPRNDIFYKDNSVLRSRIESIIPFKFKHIFVYVPTHRDYENPEREFFEKNNHHKRSIFGPYRDTEVSVLENALEQTDSIIIAKIHPRQEAEVIEKGISKRIFLFSEINKELHTSLNPIMAVSDFLISDYTTAVFDFMCLNKPIIYYFYDIEKYSGTRGLFIDPIDPICPGPIVYNINDLARNVISIVEEDSDKSKREIISDLFIKDKDGNSTQRVKDFLLRL